MSETRRRALTQWAVVAVVLAVLVVTRLGLGAAGLWLDLAGALLAVAATHVASRRATAARSRRAWRWQIAAPALWALSAVLDLAGAGSLAVDLCRLATGLSAGVAWWLTSRAVDTWSRARLAVDGGLAVAAVFVAAWPLWFSTTWDEAPTPGDGIVAIMVPLAALWAATAGFGLTVTEMRARARVMPAFFVAALVLLAASDMLDDQGLVPLWGVAWYLLAVGAWRYGGTSKRGDIVSTRWEFSVAPYVLILPAVAAYAVTTVQGPIPRAMLVTGLVIGALLIVRQHVTLLENGSLVRRLARTEQLLRHQATHDHLTGLAGRALLWERLEAAAASTQPVAVVFVDLDDFKEVNDTYGHAAGDDVLVSVARRITSTVASREDEALAVRMSGDEFALLLVGDAAHCAEGIANRLVTSIREPYRVGDDQVTVGASVGVARAEGGQMGPSALLRAADVAMYEIKHAGKGGVSVAGD